MSFVSCTSNSLLGVTFCQLGMSITDTYVDRLQLIIMVGLLALKVLLPQRFFHHFMSVRWASININILYFHIYADICSAPESCGYVFTRISISISEVPILLLWDAYAPYAHTQRRPCTTFAEVGLTSLVCYQPLCCVLVTSTSFQACIWFVYGLILRLSDRVVQLFLLQYTCTAHMDLM